MKMLKELYIQSLLLPERKNGLLIETNEKKEKIY